MAIILVEDQMRYVYPKHQAPSVWQIDSCRANVNEMIPSCFTFISLPLSCLRIEFFTYMDGICYF